jgi:hypothetical protein
MYSQDLPDWEYNSRLSKIMIGFMACGSCLRKAILRVSPYFIRLLAAMLNLFSHLLCKHLFYHQQGWSNQKHFSIFHMSVLTTVPDRSQAVPSRRNGDSRINMPSWVPQKTHASPAPQARARPTCSTSVMGSRSPSKLGLQAPTLEAQPQSGA